MKNILLYLLLTFCSISGFSQEKLQIKGNIKGIPNDAKVVISANGTETVIEHRGGVFEVAMHVDDAPNIVGINILYDDIDKYTVFFFG
ncbi:MAG: hypothetical protein LBI72_11505 [Flavobacteriaceae bacterium]|jgi:hypothetical protein|nr:hypothetical protein [Flavobacteriaceae bacterium]